ncbi:MAG TPA: SDR family oxidoreductase [Chthoniobacteraceae bacterium]|nr:SDR family oxidoreductase [Chthoniobacteraceae bacterium]
MIPPAPSGKPPLWDFSGECVIVSGGARGIGAGIVAHFARHGAEVIFGDIDRTGAEELCATLKTEKLEVHFVESDFAAPDAWLPLRAEAERLRLHPSLVIPNAGIASPEPLETSSAETFDRLIAVNLRSAWLAARDFGPLLRQRSGASLVLVGSVMARFGTPGNALYTASKAALSGLLRSLCAGLSPGGVRVNMVVPGYILNDPPNLYRPVVPPALWRAFHARFGHAAAEANPLLQPLPSWGEPEDIAQAISFLHSPAARYITGVELPVDGGLLTRSPITPGRGNEGWRWTGEMQQWLRQQGVDLPDETAAAFP